MLNRLRIDSAGVTGLAIAPDQQQILVATRSKIFLVDRRSLSVMYLHEGYNQAIKVSWLDNERFVHVDAAGNVKIVFSAPISSSSRHFGPTVGSAVTAAALAPDRLQLVTGHSDGICRLRDVESGKEVRNFAHAGVPIRAIAVTTDVAMMAAVDTNNALAVWNMATAAKQMEFQIANTVGSYVTGLAMRGASTVVIAWKNGNIQVLDVPGGASSTVQNPLSDLLCLAVTPDGKRAVTGHGDGSVAVWNLTEATPVANATLPIGKDRIELAYYAVLDNPQLFEVLESFDESVLAAVVSQIGGSAEEALAGLKVRHGGATPPLWSAWTRTVQGGLRNKT